MKILKIAFSLSLLLLSCIARSQLIINEIMAANASTNYETDYYNFPDWIELYNSGVDDINLANYFISDDASELQKWAMPSVVINADEYYLIYCDKEASDHHTNFGLSTNGEAIFLSNQSGIVIDQVEYPEQYPDISYGRNPTALNNWFYCATPTPNAQNLISSATKLAAEVDFSIPGGRLLASADLSLSGVDIRYTTDGSIPTPTSQSYTQELNINETTVIKARSFQEEFLPGLNYANTYFIGEHEFTLPVVSLSFNNEYFYDNTIGIHVRGNNGTAGLCGSVANWFQPWERAGYLEYFDSKGEKQLSQAVGLKLAGGCTRGRDQKSISIYARSKYGNNDFDYPLFSQKPDIIRYKSVLLRNSGNDQDQTLLRDAFIQALVNTSVDLDYQSYQPAIVYFNGEYRGIMNLREKADEDYFISNYELGSDEIDFIEGILFSEDPPNYTTLRGTQSDYQEILDFISGNSLVSDENYNFIATGIDVQEYINYMVLQIYIGNRDWPGNNLKIWKRSINGKWRWIVFDLDYGFGFRLDAGTNHTFESLHHATETGGPNHPNPPWSTLLFRKMLENDGFQKQFLGTFQALIHSSFTPEWCHYILDSLSSIIDTEIYYNNQKYGRTKAQWLDHLNTIKTYATNRYNFMPDYVEAFFDLVPENKVSVSVTNNDIYKGKAEVNKVTVQRYPFNMITYSDIPLTLKALPAYGFRFVQWNITGTDSLYSEEQEIVSLTSTNMNIEPVFETIDEIHDIYLNEIAPVTTLFRDEFDEKSGFVELYNNSDEEAILMSCFISDDPDNLMRYAIPDSTRIPGNGFSLIFLDAEARQGPLHAPFKADTDGEQLFLSQKVGTILNILDSVSFTLLVENHSFGKYSDGIGEWQHMVNITPGQPNDPDRLNDMQMIHELTCDISIYPNPSDGIITVSLNESQLIESPLLLDIIDISGKVVYPKILLNSSRNILYLTQLEKGIYFSRVYDKNRLVFTGKIVITR